MNGSRAPRADKNKRVELACADARPNIVARFVPKQRGLQRRDRVGRVCVAVLIEHVRVNEVLDELERTAACRVVAINHSTHTERSYERLLIAFYKSLKIFF